MSCVWDSLIGQTRAVGFLRAAAESGAVSHAYLFVGPNGSGKKSAARALACAVFCSDGGCGSCPACRRVRSGHHPDLHLLRPEGASSYLVGQIRELIHDVNLKPVEASHKVYILDEVDRFDASAANALLKTLEEPPDDVVMVLLARSFDAVMPTIASRCQIVRFSAIPPSVAEAMLVERTGATVAEARSALAASDGVVPRAVEFVRSPARRAMRDLVLDIVKRLPLMDGHDVLVASREILGAAKAPSDELKALQADELTSYREVLGKSVSAKPMEERHKRELTAREREGLMEVMSVSESWLRDCLVLASGEPDLVVNPDAADSAAEVAAVITPAAALRALDAVSETRRRVSYNVSPQLAIDAMLFDIREVLRCPR
jgi:DNA polymerase-3 subunit delta'